MIKTTQGNIRKLINYGAAKKLTDTTTVNPGELNLIAVSFGVYGMNGAIFKHNKSAQLYAIPTRSTLLSYYV